MKKITVKRILPKELPEDLVFRLNQKYHTELGEFVVIVDNTNEIMYVNKKLSIPKKDIDGFVECATFPDCWLCDYESGKADFLDYVYNKYGDGVYRTLLDAHKRHLKQQGEHKAKEAIEAILPLIEKEVSSENPVVEYDEYLIREVCCAGKNKQGRTVSGVIGYGDVYIFYLGYLMGAGMLKGGAK